MLKPFADSVRDITPGPPTWRTWLGLAAVPLLVMILLTTAFWAPQQDHGTARAAVVNEDRPVTIRKQIVPLGRELAGRLTHSKDSPYTWVLTDAADARKGVADGTYKAVVTIPETFSAAATSPATAAPLDATHGTLRIQTSRATDILDPEATRQIAQATLDTLDRQIVETYLDNIYIAFSTIHDRLEQAADGAGRLAEGTGRVAGGARDLSAGADRLASAADQLSGGAAQLAAGTERLAAGSGRLSAGLGQAERDTAELPALTRRLAAGARQVANGNRRLADTVVPIADQIIRLIDRAPSARSTAAQFRRLAAQCAASGGTPAFCVALADAAERFGRQAPAFDALLGRIRAAAVSARRDLNALAVGAEKVAQGNAALAAGSQKLAAGIADAAQGARALDTGVRQADSAAHRLATGADRLSGGASQLAAGGQDLAEGARRTDAGATKLAAELAKGRDQVPTYTAGERAHLKKVAAAPATAVTAPSPLHGKAVVPLFLVLALWAVALATYVVTRPVPPGALTTRTPTWMLTLHAALPGAAIAVITASALSLLLIPFLHIGVGRWSALLAVTLLAALAFVAVNQAAAAIFKRPGRLVSLAVLVLTVATGVTSTLPRFLADAEPLLPTYGAVQAIRSVVTGAGGGWRGTVALLVWAAAGTVATIIVTHRSRTVPGRRLRPGSSADR